jgi:hypothetical protein
MTHVYSAPWPAAVASPRGGGGGGLLVIQEIDFPHSPIPPKVEEA